MYFREQYHQLQDFSVLRNHFTSNFRSAFSSSQMPNSLLKIIYAVAESKLLILSQAAGVKRLLFCGVGCQVQGIIII